MAAPAPRILHIHGDFEDSAGAMRNVQLINALGGRAEHALVSGDPQRRSAVRALAKGARVSWLAFPPLEGSKRPGRLLKLAGAMAGYDLICTYGWRASDAALAHTLFADVHKLPPLVHHELALDPEDARGSRKRAWFRRFALGRAAALVAGNKAIEALALGAWDQPRARVRLIPDGVDMRDYSGRAARDLLPGLVKRRDELWIGAPVGAQSMAGPIEGVLALASMLTTLPPQWQLVLLGDFPADGERPMIEAEAARLGIDDRVHFHQMPRGKALTLFDIIALPAGAETSPPLVMAAAAAALPVVAGRESEISALLSSENGPLLADPAAPDDYAHSLHQLAERPDERKRIGLANRAKAREEHDEVRMIERTRALWWGLMGIASPAPGGN